MFGRRFDSAQLHSIRFMTSYKAKIRAFLRNFSRENIRRFIRDNITHSSESNFIIAASLGYGVFCGIIPMWGYQMVFTFATAHFLRLNKYIALLSSNISFPPFIPFIFYASYWTGCKVLGRSVDLDFSGLSMSEIGSSLLEFVLGSVVLALISGLIVTFVSWGILSITRKSSR